MYRYSRRSRSGLIKSGASARIVVVVVVVVVVVAAVVALEIELEKENVDVVEREGEVEFSAATREEANDVDDVDENKFRGVSEVVDRRICGLEHSRSRLGTNE
jgi:hypothetical protein